MNENIYKEKEKDCDKFNILPFERKLAEIVEELRMKRNLAKESAKNIESVLEEKYKAELSFDEQKRSFVREKEYLERQIDILKRKVEDNVCVSDDRVKLQIMNKTYSHEVRVLKEELRTTKSETLTLQKSLQEAEGKLNLHNTFQASIMSQVSDVQTMIKSNTQEIQDLTLSQNKVMENISKVKSLLQKYNICNQHLQHALSLAKQRNETLEKELITQKSELMVMKNSATEKNGSNNNYQELEKARQKLLEQDKMMLLNRKEHETTLNNFLESNKLLSQFMNRYAELQQKEKAATTELEEQNYKLKEAEAKLQKAENDIRVLQETRTEKVGIPVATETEVHENNIQQMDPMDFVETTRNDLAELQKSALILQSEMRKGSP